MVLLPNQETVMTKTAKRIGFRYDSSWTPTFHPRRFIAVFNVGEVQEFRLVNTKKCQVAIEIPEGPEAIKYEIGYYSNKVPDVYRQLDRKLIEQTEKLFVEKLEKQAA